MLIDALAIFVQDILQCPASSPAVGTPDVSPAIGTPNATPSSSTHTPSNASPAASPVATQAASFQTTSFSSLEPQRPETLNASMASRDTSRQGSFASLPPAYGGAFGGSQQLSFEHPTSTSSLSAARSASLTATEPQGPCPTAVTQSVPAPRSAVATGDVATVSRSVPTPQSAVATGGVAECVANPPKPAPGSSEMRGFAAVVQGASAATNPSMRDVHEPPASGSPVTNLKPLSPSRYKFTANISSLTPPERSNAVVGQSQSPAAPCAGVSSCALCNVFWGGLMGL